MQLLPNTASMPEGHSSHVMLKPPKEYKPGPQGSQVPVAALTPSPVLHVGAATGQAGGRASTRNKHNLGFKAHALRGVCMFQAAGRWGESMQYQWSKQDQATWTLKRGCGCISSKGAGMECALAHLGVPHT